MDQTSCKPFCILITDNDGKIRTQAEKIRRF